MIGGTKPLMPLPHQARGVASRVEIIGDRPLIERQAELGLVTLVRIELVAETRLMPASEKSGAGRAAVRSGDVAAGEADAGGGKGINIRCRHGLAALDADVAI